MRLTLAITFDFDCQPEQVPTLVDNLNGVVADAIGTGRILGCANATLLDYHAAAPLTADPSRQVRCQFCREMVPAGTAHLHGGDWVGDGCCWDERLRSSE